jgi:HEPN domain-containing protein
MSEREHVVAETLRWMRYALEDLQSAEAIRAVADVPHRTVCFFAQQAAEKALKAAVVFENKDVPRTHDLEAVLALIPPDWGVAGWTGQLAGLSRWATFSRYPGGGPDPTADICEEALSLSHELVEAVVQAFQIRGLRITQ